jgi:rare lipoprotein A (peptidoglycan hydrolase)
MTQLAAVALLALSSIGTAVHTTRNPLGFTGRQPFLHYLNTAVPKPDPPPPMNRALASFYDYGNASTGACGPLLTDGVANRTLPCGTQLEICAARCSPAVVDDRGPTAWTGREFDLSVSLAGAIGFDLSAGVGTVQWRIR